MTSHLIVASGDFTSLQSYAFIINWLAARIEADEVTTAGDENVYAGLTRLAAAAAAKRQAADYVRGPQSAPAKVHKLA